MPVYLVRPQPNQDNLYYRVACTVNGERRTMYFPNDDGGLYRAKQLNEEWIAEDQDGKEPRKTVIRRIV